MNKQARAKMNKQARTEVDKAVYTAAPVALLGRGGKKFLLSSN